MSIEYYKEILLDIIQGFTKPLSLNEIIENMDFPESDRNTIEEAILQLLKEGKTYIIKA